MSPARAPRPFASLLLTSPLVASLLVALPLACGTPQGGGPGASDATPLRPVEPAEPSATTPPGVPPLEPDEGPAHWIWAPGELAALDRVVLRRSFHLDAAPTEAFLWATCDNRLRVFVNGVSALRHDDWSQPVRRPVRDLLRPGSNTLAVLAVNEGGPAGLCLALDVEGAGRLISDATWRATGADEAPDGWERPGLDDGSWDRAIDLGALGATPWGRLPAARAWVPSQDVQEATDPESLRALEGFRVELLYSVPRDEEGSWVSIAFDDAGRLYASDQYGGLFRVTPPPIGGAPEATLVERVPAEIGEAQGMLWAFDALYVVVNKGGRFESGLYRVRDLDGDDALEHVELLARLDGRGEHGPHAVRLAPDGESLVVIAGNHTRLPENLVRSRVPRVWGEDQLLPRLDDPRGHAVGVLAPGGWLCRTDPEGREWELVACGMRNAYDFDFSPVDGEPYTFDSDMEWDAGLPWYRPTRVLKLASGAEFGWRHGSGKWPASYPDSLPAVLDIGLASPTGVEFGAGTSFPAPFRDALFVADWSYGKVYAVHLDGTPRFQPFLEGHPLPVTDLAVGHDGALYLTVGGRRTQSGLYRVVWTGPDPDATARPAAAVTDGPRRRLERLHGGPTPGAIDELWPRLASPDREVRFAARTALEFQEPATWRARALARQHPVASIEALLALVRCDDGAPPEAVLERLLGWPWESLRGERAIAALRVAGLAFVRERLGDSARALLAARLAPLYPRPGAAPEDDAENRELARLLAFLGDVTHVPATLDRMLRSDQPGAIDDLRILSQSPGAWRAEDVARLAAWLGEEHGYEGGASLQLYVERLGKGAALAAGLDPAEFFPDEELVDEELESVTFEASPESNGHAWTVTELAPALAELNDPRDLERGAALFERTRCLECHRVGKQGGGTGPDLTGAGGRFSARDLLVTILEPNAAISDQYRDTEFVTTGDELIIGRPVGETDGVVKLLTAPDDVPLELERASIAEERPHALSRMPAGLVDVLGREELLDLLAYVLAADADRPGR